MNEKEMESVEQFAIYVEKYNRRMYIVTLATIAMTVVLGVSAFVTINNLNANMADMSTSQWADYMEADYYYPDISQEQNIDIGKD